MVARGGFAAQQWRDKYPLAGCSQGLSVGLQRVGAGQLRACLLLDRELAQAFQARVAECLQGRFGFLACQRQFGSQGAGVNLLGGFQAVQRHLLENAGRATDVALLIGQVGGGQAQQGCLFRLAFSGLLQQLFDAGLRCARQFAQVGRRRAGASGKQADKAEDVKRAQASDHVSDPDT
ncbi:hypothetical protein FQZ97_932880 [compost metagenome]